MKLDAIGIVSRDVLISQAFYKELNLHFEKFQGDHYEAKAPCGLRVMMDSLELIQSLHPGWQHPQASGISLAFDCEKSDAVDALYHQLCASGGTSKKEPWDAFWGQRYAVVHDPDGYQIDLFAESPV